MGHHELAILVALALMAVATWGFIELAGAVIEGETHAYDERIVLALRSPQDLSDPLGPPWLEEAVRDVSALGGNIVLVGLTLATGVFLVLEGKRRTALFVLVAVFSGLMVGQFLKLGFDRARPELVPHHTHVYTASFPSGHAMGAAIVYLTLAALLVRVTGRWHVKAYLLMLGALLTVLATDVLAGWAAGAAWALGCWAAARALQGRGAVEAAEPQPQSLPDPAIRHNRIPADRR
jgi:undecaprenyl-diphosphatase